MPFPKRSSLSLTIPAALLAGCAGPTTPFGAVWTVTVPTQETGAPEGYLASDNEATTSLANVPRISIQPSRQVLHGPVPLKVVVRDPIGDLTNYDLMVRYNGYDVTRSFIRQARLVQSYGDRSLTLEKPKMRLGPEADHQIEFTYRNSHGTFAYAAYEAPTCKAFRASPVLNTGEFHPPRALLQMIDATARREGFNPAFVTALVAQESRFEPTLVSWARAIGLTQITGAAEAEIAELHPDWPRYPNLDDKSTELLRILILGGQLHGGNEWRLDPEHSVAGGVAYARYLSERWSSPANLERIRAVSLDPETELARLILASYNSGFARVAKSLEENGREWLKSSDLKEARKYVNKIFSYCNYFADANNGRENNPAPPAVAKL